MATTYTVDTLLLPTLKRRGMLPDTTETLATSDYLALANDELQSYIVPLLLKSKEEYLIYTEELTITSGQDTYAIPKRAVGGKVRSVEVQDALSATSWRPLTRVEPEVYVYNVPGNANGFYFENNNIVLTPTPSSSGTLRLKYYLMPGRLVSVASCAPITSVASLSSKVLTATTVSTWITGATDYDVVQSLPGFQTLEIDNSATRSSNTFTFTDDLDTRIVVGDYVCLAGESPIPQIPVSLHPLLAHRVVFRALEALGDPRAAMAAKSCEELKMNAIALISPRSDGNPRKCINRNGPGFGGYGRRRY